MITNIIFRRSDSPITSDKPHYPYELPKGWGWTTLPELCVLPITDGTHQTPTYTDKANGIPFLSSKDVTSKKIDWTNIKYITKDLHEILYKRIAPQKNDILLAKNGTTGVAAIVEDERVFDIYVTLAVIRPSNFIDPKFLLYIINSVFCKKQFNDHLTGIGLPNLHLTDIKKTIIPVPPYKEQVKIVDTINRLFKWIDVVDKGRLNTNELISQTKAKILDLAIHGKLVPQDPTDEPASELLKRINPKAEITCDNGHYQKLPEGWVITSISEMCENINGLWKGKKEPFVKVGVIRNANFTKDFKLDYSKIEYIDVEERAFKKRHLLNGDLIVEKSGGSDNNPVGRAILYEGKDAIFSFSNFTMVLRIHYKDVLSYKYLYYYIMSKYQKGEMRLMQTQTTGLHNLILDKYLDIPLCLPPYQEQQRIINKIEETFGVLDLIMENL